MTTIRRKLGAFLSQHHSFVAGDEDEIQSEFMDVAELVNERIIFEAGLDYHGRPIAVICGHYLPDPKFVDYDRLLARMIDRLRVFIEHEYVVIFFAGAIGHRPSWSWIFKAYRALDYRFRKNVKAVYITHPSWWPRVILGLVNRVASPKFANKVKYVHTLSELATYVPLNQVQIPPAVYEYDEKFEPEIIIPEADNQGRQFGVPLERLMGIDGEMGIPPVIKAICNYLRSTNLETEGLFRLSPKGTMVKQVIDAYDNGRPVSLADYKSPHVACGVLKSFVRKLPRPLIPSHIYDTLKRLPLCESSAVVPIQTTRVHFIRHSVFPLLPTCNIILLGVICHLLHDVYQRRECNKMDSYNLTVVWAPNLVNGDPMLDISMCALPRSPITNITSHITEFNRTKINQSGKSGGVAVMLQTCIECYHEIFEEYVDPTAPVAYEPNDSSSVSMSVDRHERTLNGKESAKWSADGTTRSKTMRRKYSSIRGISSLLKQNGGLSTSTAGVEGSSAVAYGKSTMEQPEHK